MRTESVNDPEFNWWTKKLPSRRLRVGVAIIGAATSITVVAAGSLTAGEYADDATSVKPGDILLLENTNELIRVTSVASNVLIDGFAYVKSASSNTALTPIDPAVAGTNPYLRVVGSAYREGADTPIAVSFSPLKLYNYTQIFRNSLKLTNTAIKTRLRTREQLAEAKREALQLHSMDMEMAFWFGEKSETIVSGTPLRTTQGFFNFVPASNVINAAAGDYASGMDYGQLEELMVRFFSWGASEKVGWAGAGAMLAITRAVRLAKNMNFDLGPKEKEYGFDVRRLTTPMGTLVLKNHPLWNISTGGTVGGTDYLGMSNWLAVMDMTAIKYRPLEGRDTKYLPDRQTNGEDSLASEYLTEAGIEWQHPDVHWVIKNLKTINDET
jgi:hypothetical protein